MTAGDARLKPFRRRTTSVPLASRLLIGSAILALVVATVFLGLLVAVKTSQEATDREAKAKEVTQSTLVLEKLVVDLETGLRGISLSGDERFLQPWKRARAELPRRLEDFLRLASSDPAQSRSAQAIVTRIRGYIDDYSVPLVAIARESPAAARSGIATSEGRRRTDEIRSRFTRFLTAENARAAESADTASRRSDVAVALGIGGVTLSALLIVLFGVFLARSIGRPIRSVSIGAGRLAEGELSVRLDERGPGEVGELTRAFNAMAGELERGRDVLQLQNERLRESERLKSELVSIVSHEVRTPLASVLGFTSLLLNREHDEETRRRYLEIIDSQGRRLASLLDDFLDVQRIEEGRLQLEPEQVDLAALLSEQVQLFSALSERHEIVLRLEDGIFVVRGDSNRLAQVIGNLLSNAIKYSPEGGIVEVAAEHDRHGVRVTVTDEGLGIPVEQQQRIFTKFFRGDAATSGIAGSGLGLAFARAVVEAHGGQMTFRSAVGAGSTFSLELPIPRESGA